MFKTEEQINSRLSSEKNLVNRFSKSGPAPSGAARTVPLNKSDGTPNVNRHPVTIIPLEQPGNKLGKQKLSASAKNEIAFRARSGEGQTRLAKEFGVSQSAIGEIEQGRTRVDEVSVNKRLDEVQDVAMNKLLASLGYIDESKLEKLKATELSLVASNMSKIVGNIRQKDSNAPLVTVQIYAPELKNESSYKTIEV